MTSPFVQAFAAYRSGISKRRKQPERARRSFDFSTLLQTAVRDKVRVDQRLILRRVGRSSYEGLLASREGRLDEAASIFRYNADCLASMKPGAGRLVGESLSQAARAYFEYRIDCPKAARHRVDRALDADLELEIEHDLTLLQLHRLQLGHNLVRVDSRYGDTVAAHRMAGEIVAYLEGRRGTLGYHRQWRPKHLLATPLANRQAMARQVAGEVAVGLVARPEERSWEAFLEGLELPAGNRHRGVLIGERFELWLQAVAARCRGDVPGYFDRFEAFVAGGLGNVVSIYYAAMVDFADFCLAEGGPTAEKVARAVWRDTTVWKGVPRQLERRLGPAGPAERRPSTRNTTQRYRVDAGAMRVGV